MQALPGSSSGGSVGNTTSASAHLQAAASQHGTRVGAAAGAGPCMGARQTWGCYCELTAWPMN